MHAHCIGEAEAEESDESFETKIEWVHCDSCRRWIHLNCLQKNEFEHYDVKAKYTCLLCENYNHHAIEFFKTYSIDNFGHQRMSKIEFNKKFFGIEIVETESQTQSI